MSEKEQAAFEYGKHFLPCDVWIGRVVFRKGVSFETLQAAAERWFEEAEQARRRKNK